MKLGEEKTSGLREKEKGGGGEKKQTEVCVLPSVFHSWHTDLGSIDALRSAGTG